MKSIYVDPTAVDAVDIREMEMRYLEGGEGASGPVQAMPVEAVVIFLVIGLVVCVK